MKKISKNLYQIENIFPEKTCKKILNLFKNEKKWKLINQTRINHYKHVFKAEKKLDKKLFPTKKEIYYAKFYRNDNLKKKIFIIKQIKKYIFPILKKLKITYKNFDIRCHKFKSGNFLRMHYDHYAGNYAVTINLNKEWKWDWGGLLCVIDSKNAKVVNCLCPQWNSMNILCSYNKNKSSPHFVTSVENYALSPRYSITIFFSQ